MSRLWERVDAWWFEDAPATRLALLRILIGAFAFVYLAVRIDLLAGVGRTASNLFEPVGLARLLHAPIQPALFDAVVLATLLANVAFILGWKFRVTGPAFGVLLLFVLSYRNSWSMIYHTDNAMVLHALILGCTRAADAWALDARRASREAPVPHGWRYGWPVRLMCVVVVCTYVVAGLAKVLGPLGWAWANGESMRGQILVDALRKELLGSGAPPLAFALADELWLFTLLGVGTLILELGAPAALLSRRAGGLWAVNAFLMHWGIYAIMGILFRYQMIGLIFAPFFRIERLVDRRRSAAGRRPVVIYDGECRFCRAQIAWLTAFDVTGRLRFVSLHDPSVARDHPGLAHADLMSQMYVVDPGGRSRGGADAVRYLTRRLPLFWWAAPLLHVPGSRPFWQWAYRQVARHRYVFGRACDDGTCRL